MLAVAVAELMPLDLARHHLAALVEEVLGQQAALLEAGLLILAVAVAAPTRAQLVQVVQVS